MNDKTITFPEGVRFNRNQKAPDYVVGTVSINAEEFDAWLSQNQHLINGRGYLNLDILISKKSGSPYVRVNTYGLNEGEPPF